MTSVTSSTAFIATKYCENFERKYNDDSLWIIDTGTSDLMIFYKRFDCPHKVIFGDNSETYAKSERKLHCYFGLGDDNDRVSNYACLFQN